MKFHLSRINQMKGYIMKHISKQMQKALLLVIFAVIAVTYSFGCDEYNVENNSELPLDSTDMLQEQAPNGDALNTDEAVPTSKITEQAEALLDSPDDVNTEEIKSVKVWPENEFTSNLPFPAFMNDDALTSSTKDSFAIVFCTPVSVEDALDYIQQVKDFGYIGNTVEETNDVDIYTYVSENDTGYKVTVTYYKTMFSVTLDKVL